MMGPSDAVTRIIREVNRVAQSDFSVIIQGETGSGKELVARAIHQLSRRGRGPLYSPGLRGHPRNPHRKRTLRLPERGLHRGHGPQGGEIRSSPGRHLIPGRDCQSAPGVPGETAAGPPGEGGPAPGSHPADQDRRAPAHRQQPGAPGTGGVGPDAGGSLLPPE